MHNVTLGHTNAQVSELCLGAMFFGTTTPAADSERLLDLYLDAGGNFIDTANIYATWRGHGGESETVLGAWLKARGNRNRVFLASKVGFPMPDGNGLSAAQIALQVENSLKRMGIESIDLYYAHRDDRSTPLEETLEAFDKLVRAGKVRYLGFSNYRPWRLMKAISLTRQNGWAPLQAIQQRHTYLRPEPEAKFADGFQIVLDNDLNDLCAEEGITILAYSVLLGGAYTRPDRAMDGYHTPLNERRLERLNAMAKELNISPNTLILAWMRHAMPPVLPLIAASTEAQLRENLAACDVPLSAAQMAILNEGLPV